MSSRSILFSNDWSEVLLYRNIFVRLEENKSTSKLTIEIIYLIQKMRVRKRSFYWCRVVSSVRRSNRGFSKASCKVKDLPKKLGVSANTTSGRIVTPRCNLQTLQTALEKKKHYSSFIERTTTTKMADSGDKKDSVTITPQVYALMAAHAASHPMSAVHGILVGSRSGDEVTVSDAFPVCHGNPTKTLVETAFSLVQSILEGDDGKSTIIGWFTAPELIHETKPGPVALRIVANLAAAMGEIEPVLLVMNNDSIVKLLAMGDEGEVVTASSTIQAFGKDFGMQWMESIDDLSVKDETKATKALIAMLDEGSEIRIVRDLVDHWDQGASSEWTSASSFASLL